MRFPPQLIKASAGTGKTYALSSRFLELLIAGEVTSKILATTFTKKAAAEIKDRIFHRLISGVLTEDGLTQLQESSKVPTLSKSDISKILLKLVSEQEKLNVVTIDSFLATLLRSLQAEAGLPEGWTQVSGVEAEYELEETILRGAEKLHKSGLSALINEARVPKFGSSMAARFRKIITLASLANETSPECWQLSYSPVEQSRIDDLIANLYIIKSINKDSSENKVWIKSRQKVEEALKLKQFDKKFFNEGIIGKVALNEPKFSGAQISEDVLVYCRKIIDAVVNILRERYSKNMQARYELASTIYDIEIEEMRRRGTVTFAGVGAFLDSIINKDQLLDIYFRIDASISHLLLDEFQDTSFQQWRIIEPIASEILAKSGEDYSFFCVGDIKQAIYRWRGGVAEVFDSIERDWPQIKVENFNETRRCSHSIVDFINKVFVGLKSGDDLSYDTIARWNKDFAPHASLAPLKEPGYVEINWGVTENEDSKENNDNEDVEDKNIHSHVNDALKKIIEIHTDDPDSTIGVLFRTNRLGEQIRQYLEAAGLGDQIMAKSGVLISSFPSIQILQSLMKLLDHPGDSLSRFVVEQSSINKWFTDSGDIIGCRRLISEKGFGRAVSEIFGQFNWLNGEELIAKFYVIAAAFEFEKKFKGRCTEFLRKISELNINSSSTRPISILTVHSAKGLEFDHVIFIDESFEWFVSKNEPIISIRGKEGQIDRVIPDKIKLLSSVDPEINNILNKYYSGIELDTINLLYVAFTRARFSLFLFLEGSKGKLKQILSSALEVDSEGTTTFGERKQKPKKQIETEPSLKELNSIATDNLLSIFGIRTKHLKRLSPSHLEGGKQPGIFKVISPKAAILGRKIHLALSKIEWIDSNNQVEDIFASNNESQDITQILNNIRCPEVQRLFIKANFPSESRVLREYPFAVKTSEGLLVGTFDRLVIFNDGLQIIDFKSDRFQNPESEVGSRVDFYRPQILAYQQAASQLFNVPIAKVEGILAFMSIGKVVRV